MYGVTEAEPYISTQRTLRSTMDGLWCSFGLPFDTWVPTNSGPRVGISSDFDFQVVIGSLVQCANFGRAQHLSTNREIVKDRYGAVDKKKRSYY